jgi:hypothetical protein
MDHDMYGHTININFDKKGDTHNTVIGGCFSLIIKISMLVYISLNLKKLILSEGDELGAEEFLLAHEQADSNLLPEIDYLDT